MIGDIQHAESMLHAQPCLGYHIGLSVSLHALNNVMFDSLYLPRVCNNHKVHMHVQVHTAPVCAYLRKCAGLRH